MTLRLWLASASSARKVGPKDVGPGERSMPDRVLIRHAVIRNLGGRGFGTHRTIAPVTNADTYQAGGLTARPFCPYR